MKLLDGSLNSWSSEIVSSELRARATAAITSDHLAVLKKKKKKSLENNWIARKKPRAPIQNVLVRYLHLLLPGVKLIYIVGVRHSEFQQFFSFFFFLFFPRFASIAGSEVKRTCVQSHWNEGTR